MSAAPKPGHGYLNHIEHRMANYIAERDSTANLGGTSYGVMCERIEHFAHSSVRCGGCDGLGFRELSPDELAARQRKINNETDPDRRAVLREDLSRDSTCRFCRGTGYLYGDRVRVSMDSMFTSVKCSMCWGTGTIQRRRRRKPRNGRSIQKEALSLALGVDPNEGQTCPRCHGIGYVVPVDVRITGSSKHGKVPKGVVNSTDDDLERPVNVPPMDPADWAGSNDDVRFVELGEMSRMLERIRSSSPKAVQVLEAYYGPDGDRYGQHKWGRLFAVWPLTDAGMKIANESKERSNLNPVINLRALDFIAAERGAEEASTVVHMHRRILLNRADNEARRLLAEATRALREAQR